MYPPNPDSPPPAALTNPWRTPLVAVSILGAVLLTGCNRAEAPETAPAAPASSAPAAPATSPGSAAPGTSAPAATSQPAPSSSATGSATPSGSSPASSVPAATESPAPSSSATTPGTPDAARATLPSSETAGAKPSEGTAVDAKSTQPKGDLTKEEEAKGMPEALQVNNHSSPALDTEPKKP